MKQTAFVAITILAGLASVFLAPQWRLSAEEPPRLQRQGNGPPKERGPNRPEHGPERGPERAGRGREPMRNHKPPSHEGVLVIDHLMNRFDEVIARLDRIERRVGAGHNPNIHQPPHGPDHSGNEERMKEEGRRHDFERHMRDAINDRMRQSEEMTEHVHRTHEEIRERIEERMHQAREIMEQTREQFMELNERIEELEEGMGELEERIEALHPPVPEIAE